MRYVILLFISLNLTFMKTPEKQLVKPTRDDKEKKNIRESFLSSLQIDITEIKAKIVMSTSNNEKEYYEWLLKRLYIIKETYGE